MESLFDIELALLGFNNINVMLEYSYRLPKIIAIRRRCRLA
jgi:hypothetical protein